MLILGIETSCDETGVAIYDANYAGSKDSHLGLLANVLHSQVATHNLYGGVVPELASRDHIKHILPLCKQALSKAGKTKADLKAIAYTKGPGLAGALLVGATFANSLALSLSLPVIGIHHLAGHLLSSFLSKEPPKFPFVALLVSGGHTQLMLVKGLDDYELLGETIDDAVGECLDKSAKLLGLSYPGGAEISALAMNGTHGAIILPRPMLHADNLNFSFSGLKTAVLTKVKNYENNLNTQWRADLACALLEAVVEVLVKKSMLAMQKVREFSTQNYPTQLIVAGGVAANVQLRAALNKAGSKYGYKIFYPEASLCTDNGAMIAFAGALHLQAGLKSRSNYLDTLKRYTYEICPRWDLQSNE